MDRLSSVPFALNKFDSLIAAAPSKFGVGGAGEADLYPRFGAPMEWDTAAGQAILEAAGGRVETFAGAALGYGKPGLKNDSFIAWGRRPGS